MTERIFPPISPVTPTPRVTPTERRTVPKPGTTGDFQKILESKLGTELKISAHAQKRMAERGISLITYSRQKRWIGKSKITYSRQKRWIGKSKITYSR
jgi:hypothetical protein